MPRKSKATIEAERHVAAMKAARERYALRWSDDSDIAPDVPPPVLFSKELTTGWTFNVYGRRIEVACSSSIYHAIGRTDKTNAQHPLSLYSTRTRALRALRVALEHEFAAELAKIDTMMEKEALDKQ